MYESQEECCNLCGRQCPVTDLHCSKGQRYFEQLKQEKNKSMDNVDENIRENKENTSMKDDRENMDQRDNTENKDDREHRGHGEHKGHCEHGEHKGHCEHGEHGGYGENGGHGEHREHCEHKEHRGHRHHGLQAFENQEDELSLLLHKSSHFLHHKRGGKRGQGKILKILAEHPEISQKELQDLLGIEPGSMSELVIKLEHKGLITRAKDEADKRMTKLMITDLGLELSKEIETRDSEEDKSLTDSLTQEEKEQLKALLTKLLQGWEESYGSMHLGRRGRGDGGHDGCCGKHHGRHGNHDEDGHGHRGHHNHHHLNKE